MRHPGVFRVHQQQARARIKTRLHTGLSEPDREMLLLFELLPEKNNTEKEKINGTADSRVCFDVFPSLFHSFAPMNIVKNEYRTSLCLFQQPMKIIFSGFTPMIAIYKSKIY